MLVNVIPDLDLQGQASRDFGPGNESFRVIPPENLANQFFQCEELGLSHEIDQLADKIISEASHMKSTPTSNPHLKSPRVLSANPATVVLHCKDCVTFDDFLKTPDVDVLYFFKLHAKRRTHLEERLRGSACRTETIKKGRPYTFVATKKGLEWESAMKKWNQRCGIALRMVEEIGPERLKSLLWN